MSNVVPMMLSSDIHERIPEAPGPVGLTETPQDQEMTGMAQELAQNLIGVWKGLISPVAQLAEVDHTALGNTVEHMSKIADEIRKINNELGLFRRQMDTLGQERTGFSARLAAGEGRLAELAASHLRTQGDLSKVLEAQAELLQALKRQNEVLSSLDELAAQFRQSMKALAERGDALEHRLNATATESSWSAGRLRVLNEDLQAQAAANGVLGTACTRLLEQQETLERRINTQAGAIRVLHSNLHDLGDWLEKVRTALQEVEEIVRASVDKPLPEQL